MLLVVEKGIIGGICHSIHRYKKANNKYIENYDKDMESSCLKYLDANNLYEWAISPKTCCRWFRMGSRAISI